MNNKNWVLITGAPTGWRESPWLSPKRAGAFCATTASKDSAQKTRQEVQDAGADCLLVDMDLAQDNAAELLMDQCAAHWTASAVHRQQRFDFRGG